MGVDFIRKRARSKVRLWDRGRQQLATPNLFTVEPTAIPMMIPGEIIDNACIKTGDALVIEPAGSDLVGRQGLTTVAHFINPPATVFQAVKESCGIAKGVVHHVHTIAGVVEVSLC